MNRRLNVRKSTNPIRPHVTHLSFNLQPFIPWHPGTTLTAMVLRTLLPRQTLRSCSTSTNFSFSRTLSTSLTRREPGISDTIDDMVGKLRQVVKNSTSHAEQFEGVQEEGLRMLVFGKPGSGKVRFLNRCVCRVQS